MDLNTVNETFDESVELYDRAVNTLHQCLAAYENRCKDAIHQIALSDFDNAQPWFDLLAVVQTRLAKLLFKYEFPLGERLEIFTREFDRIDDEFIRRYWHTKFVQGLGWPE
jgi:hypothetical protein